MCSTSVSASEGEDTVKRRIITRPVVALVFMIVVCTGIGAQSLLVLTNETEIEAFETEFLDSFLRSAYVEAFQTFRTPVTALSTGEIDNLEASTISQLANLRDTYGDPVDAKFARRTEVGGWLLRREYLLRYEFLPLRAQFVYYSNGQDWRLTYFGWDDNFVDLFGN
jgi:hypothetical protein